MTLVFTFLSLLIFAYGTSAEECVPEKFERCVTDMRDALNDAQSQSPCQTFKNARDCTDKYIARCVVTVFEQRQLRENLAEVNRGIDLNCAVESEHNNRVDIDDDAGVQNALSDEGTDACTEEEAEACVSGMIQTFVDGESNIDCGVLRNAKDCLIELADRCLDDDEKEEAQQNLNQMVSHVNLACPAVDDDNDGDNDDDDDDDENNELTDREKEMLECLADEENLMSYVGQCAEQTFREMSSGSFSYGRKIQDVNCQAFLSISRCVSGKVSDVCGEEVEKPFFSGMMIALKSEDPKAAQSSGCVEALEEAESYLRENTRKRRSISNVSFAKLMP